MSAFGNYIVGIIFEGVLIGVLFWVITFITMESSSLWGAVRASLLAEVVGNTPYLWSLPATSPPALAMTMIAAGIFVFLVLKVGELTLAKACYGTAMTYFVLVALVTCNA